MKPPRLKKYAAVFAVAALGWMVSAPLLGSLLIAEKEIEGPDAILVLAGSAVYRERNTHAAKLFLDGKAPLILLTNDDDRSGWSDTEGANLRFVELARNELIAHGVPQERIRVLEPKVTGTIEEARLLASVAEGLGVKKLLLVTSSYHSARALRTFEEVASADARELEVGMSAVPTGIETPSVMTWWLSLQGWRFVAGEYVKSVYYETLL